MEVYHSIHAIVGTMAGGKTDKLIKRAERFGYRGKPFLVFKPDNSIRDGETPSEIKSRFGVSLPAVTIPHNQPQEIVERLGRGIRLAFIDEAHMFDSSLESVLETLLDRGKMLHVSLLNADYGAEMFPITRYVLTRAESVKLCYGVCLPNCGRDGVFNQAFLPDNSLLPYSPKDNIKKGDVESSADDVSYLPKCIDHFIYPPGSSRFDPKRLPHLPNNGGLQ